MNHQSINTVNSKTEIPLQDTLFLSPIEKYKIYGRFPYKLMLHLLLVIATTSQVKIILKKAILILSYSTQYTRAQERMFYNIFISDVRTGLTP
jgi:hypothetical protein